MLGIVISCAKGDLEFYTTCGLFLWMCVVYKALGDTLRMDFAGAFLSCGSEWYPLSCGLE